MIVLAPVGKGWYMVDGAPGMDRILVRVDAGRYSVYSSGKTPARDQLAARAYSLAERLRLVRLPGCRRAA